MLKAVLGLRKMKARIYDEQTTGVAELKIKEIGSRYFFVCLYIWLEKYLSRGDYRKC